MVTVNECRDSMKSTLLRYMISMFVSIIAAVFYLGSELATIKATISHNTDKVKEYKEENNYAIKEINQTLNVVLSHSNSIFEKCCDNRIVYKSGGNTSKVQ